MNVIYDQDESPQDAVGVHKTFKNLIYIDPKGLYFIYNDEREYISHEDVCFYLNSPLSIVSYIFYKKIQVN